MPKDKHIVAYSPTSSDFKHMLHCTKLGLIKLGMTRESEFSNMYHLIRTDDSKTPVIVHYFLKDFKKPPMPSNRQLFTEKECYERMFAVYKEFYMRDNNITEVVIAEIAKKDTELTKKPAEKKIKKPKQAPKDLLNFPFKQMDLMEMINICEKEQEDDKKNNTTPANQGTDGADKPYVLGPL